MCIKFYNNKKYEQKNEGGKNLEVEKIETGKITNKKLLQAEKNFNWITTTNMQVIKQLKNKNVEGQFYLSQQMC